MKPINWVTSLFTTCIALFLFPQILTAQTQESTILQNTQMRILKQSANSFNQLIFQVRFFSPNCQIPKLGFEHLTPVVSIYLQNDTTNLLYSGESFFVSLDSKSCMNDTFQMESELKIPLEHLKLGKNSYLMKVSLKNRKSAYTVSPVVFSFTGVSVATSTTSAIPYIKGTKSVASAQARFLKVQSKVSSNTDSRPSISLVLMSGGKICATEKIELAYTGKDQPVNFHIPYTHLTLSPGKQVVHYEVYADASNVSKRLLYTDSIEFTQPQLVWLVFESERADIHVEGMDATAAIGRMFSKSAGRGMVDAFFTLGNTGETIFSSAVAKHSGNIPNHKGAVQTYRNEPLSISFWDHDPVSNEFIYKHVISELGEEKKTLNLSVPEKVKSFDFHYHLIPVDERNFRGLN